MGEGELQEEENVRARVCRYDLFIDTHLEFLRYQDLVGLFLIDFDFCILGIYLLLTFDSTSFFFSYFNPFTFIFFFFIPRGLGVGLVF